MPNLEKIAKLILDGLAKKVIVMAGAGISTPSGLPDFRTPGLGLFTQVMDKFNLPYPEAIFDIFYFRRDPRPFFRLAKSLYPGLYQPNDAHRFVKLLQDKNLLLRMYTQNIDGLETLAGVDREKLVEAHGSFATASCIGCKRRYDAVEIKDSVFNDEIPKCKSCNNVIKPDIVFYGELLPERFMLYVDDTMSSDLLIVMGTSLEVYPFAGVADHIPRDIPRLLINKQPVGTFVTDPRENDVMYIGDVISGVRELCKLLKWDSELTDKPSRSIG